MNTPTIAPVFNSIVFAGSEFSPRLLDERTFFDGNPDPSTFFKAGPIGNFQYLEGQYSISVNPDRIELHTSVPEVLPDPLVAAAREIAERLEPVRSLVSVTGVGFQTNCVLSRNDLGVDGRTFCMNFAPSPEAMSGLLGREAGDVEVFGRVRLSFGQMIYDIRVEPEQKSRGQNVWVAIHRHQNIDSSATSFGLSDHDDHRMIVAQVIERLPHLSRWRSTT